MVISWAMFPAMAMFAMVISLTICLLGLLICWLTDKKDTEKRKVHCSRSAQQIVQRMLNGDVDI